MNACAPNIVLPLTSFTGGELRICQAADSIADHASLPSQFIDLAVASGPVSFNAKDCPHEVLPSQGLRVVVAAYTLQAALHLEACPELRASLTALAFPLPPVDFVYSPEDLAPRALPLSPGQRALLPSPPASVGSSALSASATATAHSCDDGSKHGTLLGPCHLPSPTPRLFLDLFAGARAPVTSAIHSLGCDCFPAVDLIIDASRDILDDAFFDLLCRIADSGLVGAALDGLIVLENPASSLTFHDPLMMSWIESE
ncbi:unnamed protein product, partial [Symbiodinium necroappetens]